jgi:hypothetical protein
MLKFELSEAMVNIIGRALGAQPHDAVRATIEELQKQINAQQKPVEPIEIKEAA